MWKIFRLIRIRTIIFAILTMYAMRYLVILPILELNSFTLQMNDFSFFLLVLSIACLISGAYVINDYFDTKTDRVSGIREVVVGNTITRRTAITLHSVFNLIAVGISFYLGYAVGVWKIGILFLLVSGVLWFYSSYYKKYFILGNVLVGLLFALIPISVVVYEIPLLNMAYADILLKTDTNFIYMFYWVLGFAWFIFLNTLMYEINKDIYTKEGDRENGVETISVRLGEKTAGNVLTILSIVAIISAGCIYYRVFSDSVAIMTYLLAAVALPYIVYIVLQQTRMSGRKAQLNTIRLIMILNVGVAFFFKHFFELLFAA